MASSARIDELRKKFDENPRRYFAPLANEYRKAGDLEQAIFICQEYLPQQPGHMSGHIVYGQALFELGRFDEARQVFETALSLDPENLIALRHLGDIARQTGDSRGARGWYQRVLEADPRNEEIAQVMMTLLATPEFAHPGIASPSTLIETPTVLAESPDQASVPTDPVGFRPAGLGSPAAKAHDDSGLSVGPELSALPERQAQPAAPSEPAVSSEEIPEDELLDLGDFSIGGVPMADVGLSPSVEVPSAPEEPVAEADEQPEEVEAFTESPSVFVSSVPAFGAPVPDESLTEPALEEQVEEPGFEIEKDHPPFEADPYAIASAAALPEVELSPDITLELPDDSHAPATGDIAMFGLESYEHGIAARPAESAPLEFDSYYATPANSEALPTVEAYEPVPRSFAEPEPEPELETPEQVASWSETAEPEPEPVLETPEPVLETPEPVLESPEPVASWSETAEPEPEPEPEPSAEPAQEAFVTETMAKLYLEQGHLEAALEIYKKVAEQRPFDADLRERLRQVEALLYGPVVEPDAGPSVEPAVPAGPTIRDFLGEILRTRPVSMAEIPAESFAEEAPPAIESEFDELPDSVHVAEPGSTPVGTARVPTPAFGEEPLAHRVTPAIPAETVSGSIDALFSGAGASSTDAIAAENLAQAFAPEGPETQPLLGRPAHAASSELSLDHVFKSVQPQRAEAGGDAFSFDQFFAEDVGDTASKSGADASPGAGHADDIAQFNNWLNGLKKS